MHAPLGLSLLGPLPLLGTQNPLGLCSHLAYPQELLCHHSRKGQGTILLRLVHHSARSLHLLQTQMPRSLLGLRPRASWGPGFCPPKQMRVENGMLASTDPTRTGLFLEFSQPGSWGTTVGARVGLRCKDLSLQESE